MASNLSRVLSGMDETVITATNQVITVDPDTRQLNIPGIELVFGVEGDADSERKYFQFPRYVGDNLDLAGSFLRVSYRNANGDKDFSPIDDVALNGDSVVFSWKIHPKVVAYKGQVRFVVCAVGPDLKVKWHTTLGIGISAEGMEPDANLEATEDGVAALIAMVEQQTTAVENVGAEWVRNVQNEGTDQIVAVQTAAREAQSDAVAQIEAKGASTLATIPGEYTATVNAVQSAANAIRKKVSGEVIRVDDVSPMEHYPVVKVSGKNLIPYPFAKNGNTNAGGTFTALADGGISGSGTPVSYCDMYLYNGEPLAKNGSITVSLSGTRTNIVATVAIYDDAGNELISKNIDQSPIRLNLDEYKTATRWLVLVKRKTDNVEMSGTAYLKIERGDTATEYTPYIDPTTVTVRRCGKNVLSLANLGLNQTSGKGVIEDGVLTVTGYLLSYRIPAGGLVGKNCVISCKSTRSGEKGGGFSIEFRDAQNGKKSGIYRQNELSPTIPFTVPEGTADIVFFFYASGSNDESGTATYENIQVEIGDVASAYEPHEGETQIPASDGTVSGLTAVSPTMTLLTDTAGVNIECEYSRDTNVVIAEILEKITALGG